MDILNKVSLQIFVLSQLVQLSFAECQRLRVGGTIYQKGLEGEYDIQPRTCADGYSTYLQREPAAGWAATFYLYFYQKEDALWTGWMFSIYDCSDIPFVRNIDRTHHPEKAAAPWEEYLEGTFVVNHNIKVDCIDDELSPIAIVLIILLCAVVVLLIGLLPLFYIKYARRKRSVPPEQNQPNDTGHTNSHLPTVFRSSPPPYCEQVPDFTTTTHTSGHMTLQSSAMNSLSFDSSQNTAYQLNPSLNSGSSAFGFMDSSQQPPSYEESMASSDNQNGAAFKVESDAAALSQYLSALEAPHQNLTMGGATGGSGNIFESYSNQLYNSCDHLGDSVASVHRYGDNPYRNLQRNRSANNNISRRRQVVTTSDTTYLMSICSSQNTSVESQHGMDEMNNGTLDISANEIHSNAIENTEQSRDANVNGLANSSTQSVVGNSVNIENQRDVQDRAERRQKRKKRRAKARSLPTVASLDVTPNETVV